MKRVAVVLFNLGGPDRPEAIKPFLFNLFNDPAIMRQPAPIRWMLAKLISSRRAPVAREIYEHMGGRSPLVPETEAQGRAIEQAVSGIEAKTFVCMRYWHPMTEEAVDAVRAYDPDFVVLLPLYPQFSGTTTGSSFDKWARVAARRKLTAPTARICCYPDEAGFIDALADRTRTAYNEARQTGEPRVLFSAHGLPMKFIDGGDPYRRHIEMTVAGVVERLGIADLDYVTCYQSRVGPLEWIKPYTEDEIVAAASLGRPLVVVPVAFVSEHSETLVELDIEYGELARENGAPAYVRAPTVGTDGAFIKGLASMVERAALARPVTTSDSGEKNCVARDGECRFAVDA